MVSKGVRQGQQRLTIQKICAIFVSVILMTIGIGRADDKTGSSDTLTPEKIVLAGAAVGNSNPHTKDTPETQASKDLVATETLKLLELLENPEKRQKAIESLKNQRDSSCRAVNAPSPFQDWWPSVCQWTKRDNILFVAKAIIKILLILSMYVVLRRLVNHFVAYYTQRIPLLNKDKHSQSATVAFIKTVTPIIRSTVHWILIILAALLILSELNINIMPIIYSFSVIGLAISIGSQTLVKDLINGVMTLFEGNMAVGDIVTVGTFKGEVESISLRCIHLRHSTGELQTIPFSEVNYVINHSRDYAVANIEFGVCFQADLKQVEDALQAAYEQIKNDKQYAGFIKGNLKKLGIGRMDDWSAKVHAGIKIIPDPHKVFLNEFYRLLIPELQKRNIPMPVMPFAAAD